MTGGGDGQTAFFAVKTIDFGQARFTMSRRNNATLKRWHLSSGMTATCSNKKATSETPPTAQEHYAIKASCLPNQGQGQSNDYRPGYTVEGIPSAKSRSCRSCSCSDRARSRPWFGDSRSRV
jgi:hypothetical protein